MTDYRRPLDILLLAALGLAGGLSFVFRERIDGGAVLALKDAAVAAGYLVMLRLAPRIRKEKLRFTVRLAATLIVFNHLNHAIANLQLLLHGHWFDDAVLRFDRALYGFQPVLELQQLVSPPLTEWLMFAYVAYLPLLLIIGLLLYRRDSRAAERYLLALGISNVVGNFAFLLFPVAGPTYHMADAFTTPLRGGPWTWAAEWLRHNGQFMGGRLPSLHCANTTVIAMMAWRYDRPTFRRLAPLVLSIYLATVYGRFHYAADVPAGLALGALAVALSRGRKPVGGSAFGR